MPCKVTVLLGVHHAPERPGPFPALGPVPRDAGDSLGTAGIARGGAAGKDKTEDEEQKQSENHEEQRSK